LTPGLEHPSIRGMLKPSPRFRSIFLEGSKYLQIILLTTSFVCLAFNSALMKRNQATRQRLKPVIEDLKKLQEKNAISSKELHAIKDQFDPLMYPMLHDPWLLRYTIPIGSGCMVLNSLMMLLCLRWKSQAMRPNTGDNQATVNG
jgi:hypothetical protein